jgi:hypothetical protein
MQYDRKPLMEAAAAAITELILWAISMKTTDQTRL